MRSASQGFPDSAAAFEDLGRAALKVNKDEAARAATGFLESGEADTMARNRSAFDTYLVRPRVLVDASEVRTTWASTSNAAPSLFDSASKMPMYLSPIAASGAFMAEGEAGMARAAARAGFGYVVPTFAFQNLNLIFASAGDSPLAYQFYLIHGQRERSFELLETALSLGATAVVVTVDVNAPRWGSLNQLSNAVVGKKPVHDFTWDTLEEVKRAVDGRVPIFLKGVQTAEDAEEAVKRGITRFIVSNHGGRACGGARAALHSLEEIAGYFRAKGMLATAKSRPVTNDDGVRVEILYDSGVRSGRDVFRALCLGASAVGIGRLYMWASAAGGEDGVMALMEVLQRELQHCMAQAGCTCLEDCQPERLCRSDAPWRSL